MTVPDAVVLIVCEPLVEPVALEVRLLDAVHVTLGVAVGLDERVMLGVTESVADCV